jgi:uncharacterized membrane protein HdeD (DUF308 family)
MKRLPFNINTSFNRGGIALGVLALVAVIGGLLFINFPLETTIVALFIGGIFLMQRG